MWRQSQRRSKFSNATPSAAQPGHRNVGLKAIAVGAVDAALQAAFNLKAKLLVKGDSLAIALAGDQLNTQDVGALGFDAVAEVVHVRLAP